MPKMTTTTSAYSMKAWVKGKVQRSFRLVNYLDVAKINLKNDKTLFHEPEFAFYKGNNSMPLRAIIKRGTRVLLYNNYPEEVHDLEKDQISNRLFVVVKFNLHGSTPSVFIKSHIDASSESKPLELRADKLNALIEHYDFEIDSLGKINFK